MHRENLHSKKDIMLSRIPFHEIPFYIAALIPALTFHEWSHAITADKFGDTTARQQGRLTLNPLAHLDPLGAIAILLIGFGWAKPVPIDGSRLRGSWGEFFVAAAGPTMNFLLATIFALLIHFLSLFWLDPQSQE